MSRDKEEAEKPAARAPVRGGSKRAGRHDNDMAQLCGLLLGFSGEFIGELRSDRQSITFTLVGLNHQQYPKN